MELISTIFKYCKNIFYKQYFDETDSPFSRLPELYQDVPRCPQHDQELQPSARKREKRNGCS